MFPFAGLGSLFGAAKPPKTPPWRRDRLLMGISVCIQWIQGRRTTRAWREHYPCPFKSRNGKRNCLPFQNSTGRFMVCQDRLETFFLHLRSQKIQKVFCDFCYYIWGQHCWWLDTSIIGNDCFVFQKFPLPTILLQPFPALSLFRCPWMNSIVFSIWGISE